MALAKILQSLPLHIPEIPLFTLERFWQHNLCQTIDKTHKCQKQQSQTLSGFILHVTILSRFNFLMYFSPVAKEIIKTTRN